MSLLNDDDREFMKLVNVFLRDNYKEEIGSILSQEDETAQYFVTIEGADLMEWCVEIFHRVYLSPLKTFKLLDRCLYTVSKEIYTENPENLTLKDNIHGRIVQFPPCCELIKPTLPRVYDTDKFQIITGTIIRTTPVKLLEYKRDFQCPKCKFLFEVEADISQYFKLDKPKTCPNPILCNGTKFKSLGDGSGEPTWCRDVQEVKIQEKLQHVALGSLPRAMWIVLYDDLVDTCKPGNDVQISGIVKQRWKPLIVGTRPEIEIILLAHNVEIMNRVSASSVSNESIKEFHKFWNENKNNPLEGRNKIIASVCPQIYGLYLVKLSLALVLTGGKQRVDDCGTKVRGESHLLLIGDPGTAKSQFLKFAAKVSPRSVLTTGIGSTSAGLTVAAVKEGGEWQLEAGALVLADGGVCCIDEFNSMAEKDRACIHEAMEQQTISVAKAGMVCKLSTECSVIAATNPKESRLNLNHSISVNTSIASPLLSRFDIVLVLEDKRTKEWDTLVSSHILSRRTILAPKSTFHWDIDKLREYFCVIKSIEPVMSDEARIVVLKYYQCLRNLSTSNAARTTVRMLDSLMRLVQAHARIMYCDTVHVRDAIVVITIMESSLQGSALMESSSALTTIFPEDADKEYLNQAEIILTKLQLNDILERERKIIQDAKNGIGIYKIYDNRKVILDEFIASTQLSTKKTPQFTRIANPELPSRIEDATTPKIDKTRQRSKDVLESNFDDGENSEDFHENSSKEISTKSSINRKTLSQNNPKVNKAKESLTKQRSGHETVTNVDKTTEELETLTKDDPKGVENLIKHYKSKNSLANTRIDDETLNRDKSKVNESKTKSLRNVTTNKTSDAKDTLNKSTHPLASMLQKFAYKPKSPKENLPLHKIREIEPNTSAFQSTPKIHNLQLTEESPKSKEAPISLSTISKLKMFAFEETDNPAPAPTPTNRQQKHSQPVKRNAFVLVESDDDVDFDEHSSFLDNLLLPGSNKKFKK